MTSAIAHLELILSFIPDDDAGLDILEDDRLLQIPRESSGEFFKLKG